MATFGKGTIGASPQAITIDYKQVSKFTLPTAGAVSHVSIWLDGVGSGTGNQVLRAIIYSHSAGEPTARLAVSDQVTVVDGQAAGWVKFPLPTIVKLVAADYWLGFIAGAASNTSQFWFDNVANNWKYKAETYSATPADPFGVPDFTGGEEMSILATYDEIGRKYIRAPMTVTRSVV